MLGFDGGRALLSLGDRMFRASGGTFRLGETLNARVLNIEAGTLTLGVGEGLVLKEAGLADLLSARGIPVHAGSLAAAETFLALARDLDPQALQSLLARAGADLARWGHERAQAVLLLHQLGLPVTESSLKLAEFALGSRQLTALPLLLGGMTAFRALLQNLPGFSPGEAEQASASLFLSLGSFSGGRGIQELLRAFGYRGDGAAALPVLLRLLTRIGSEAPVAAEARQLADLVDGQRLFAAAGEGSFQLILPVEADGKRGAAQLEYRRAKADEHVLHLQLELGSLGTVRTRLHLRKKKLLVTFWTVEEESRQRIAAALPDLRGSLRALPLELEGMDVFRARPEEMKLPLFPLVTPPALRAVDAYG